MDFYICCWLAVLFVVPCVNIAAVPLSPGTTEQVHRATRASKLDPTLEYKLLPLARCESEPESALTAQARCLNSCPNQQEDISKFEKWRIYDQVQEEHEVIVAKCEVKVLTQILTETWLWSTVSSPVSVSRDVVNETLCHETFREVCAGVPCEVRAPAQLSEEYSWASSRTVKKTIATITRVSGIIYRTSTLERLIKIRGEKDGIDATAASWTRSDQKFMYLWKPIVQSPKGCPLKKYKTYACHSDKEDNLWCPQVKWFLEHEGKVSIPECAGSYFGSKGGYIVGAGDSSDQVVAPYVSSMTDKNPVADHVIPQINEALTLRDTEECISECLDLTSERKIPFLVMAGYSYWKVQDPSTVIKCSPEFECQIEKPFSVCHSPLMIRVICKSGRTWYHVPSHTTGDHFTCQGTTPRVNRKSISFPTNLGEIHVNETGVFIGDKKTLHRMKHPDPIGYPIIKDISLLVKGLGEEAEKVSKRFGKEEVTTEKEWPLFLRVISKPMRYLSGVFYELSHEFKLTLLVAFLGILMLIVVSRRREEGRSSRVVVVNARNTGGSIESVPLHSI